MPCHDPNERKSLKIIWWALYVSDLNLVRSVISLLTLVLKMRDQQTSAALGLPPRIHDSDCNVPRLEPSDLAETTVLPDTSIFGQQQEHHKLYPIQMVELAVIRMLAIAQVSSECAVDQK